MNEINDLTEHDLSEKDVVLKISASKEPGYAKRVSAAMSWRLRECGFVKARCVKEISTNTAIKAVASCNQKVKEANVLLGINLFYSKINNQTTAIEMIVEDVFDRPCPDKHVEYRVSGKNDSEKKLAEAITEACLSGNKVSLKCIGSSAVYKATMASVDAKGKVFSSGYSALIVPKWETVLVVHEGVEKEVSLINIDFIGIKL